MIRDQSIYRRGFPASGFPVQSEDEEAEQPLAAGFFYRVDDATVDPVDALAENWTLTTKIDDVGAGDETTYEESLVTGIVKILRVFSSLVTAQSYTSRVFVESGSVLVYYSANGTSWTAWSNPSAPSGPGHAWFDVNDDPADQAGVLYLQYIIQDSSVSDPPARARVGDWRITSA
jgi:hypothetical protein